MLGQETNPSLILRLPSQSDVEAWDEFAKLYEPMVYRFARRRGLQDADARELVQNVMLGVARSVQRWSPDSAKGKFRTWLMSIARNQWITMISKKRLDRGSGLTAEWSLLNEHAQEGSFDEHCLEEYRREVFRIAAAKVREDCQARTWDAFWRTAILEEDANAVARQLQMSVGAVYVARSRITARLREVIQRWEQNHDEV